MDMTFDQYIANPMGIKNAVYSNKEMYRQLYTDKLNKILVREIGKVKYTLYRDKDNTYYVLMKVPSEVIANFYYDTVVMFYTNDETIKMKKTLKDYYVKFYSNDPSFVYTFAHAMLENDLFIRDLVPRMSKEAIKKVATQRNPKNEVGYVKSLYFTYLLMNNYNLFQKIIFESEGEKYDKKRLLSIIEHADIKVEQRKIKEQELNKKKKIEKQQQKTEQIEKDKNRIISNPVKNTNNINRVNKTKLVSKTNVVKKISKIKNK